MPTTNKTNRQVIIISTWGFSWLIFVAWVLARDDGPAWSYLAIDSGLFPQIDYLSEPLKRLELTTIIISINSLNLLSIVNVEFHCDTRSYSPESHIYLLTVPQLGGANKLTFAHYA